MSTGLAFGLGFVFLGVIAVILGLCRISGNISREEDDIDWDQH